MPQTTEAPRKTVSKVAMPEGRLATSDPEIALPMRLLEELAGEGMAGGATAGHISVMGFQDRDLRDWHERTAPAGTPGQNGTCRSDRGRGL